MPSVLSRRHVAINTKRAAGVVPAVIQLSKTQPKKGEKNKRHCKEFRESLVKFGMERRE